MKTLVRILGLFLLVGTFSCDDLTEETIDDVEFSESVFIDVFDNNKKTFPWFESTFIDISSHPDIEDVLDEIEKIEATSVRVRVSDITSDVVNTVTVSFPSLGLSYTVTQPAVNQDIVLDIPTSELDLIASTLENDYFLAINVSGDTDQAPVSFLLTITAVADVTIDIL